LDILWVFFRILDAVKHHLSELFVCRPCLQLPLAAWTEDFSDLHEHHNTSRISDHPHISTCLFVQAFLPWSNADATTHSQHEIQNILIN